MREILFRGKRRDNGGWLEGDLETVGHKRYIDGVKERGRVKPETVGQFTGLRDKGGARIWEGDIVRDGDVTGEVVWSDNHQWGVYITQGGALIKGCTFPLWQWDSCRENAYRQLTVISNIHDNPGLVGGGNNGAD